FGDLETLNLLLNRKADVNQRNSSGGTALINAAWRGDLEILNVLLDNGADINAHDDKGQTAAYVAAAHSQRDGFKLLQARGADVSNFSERAIRIITAEPDQDDEIMSLIHRLYRKITEQEITGPTLEEQEEIPKKILAIARESPESRAKVIDRLIDVVEDPAAKEAPAFAEAWIDAVNILGKLKATEAINVLAENLDRTGQNGIIVSEGYAPVYSAMVRIGEPAVPRLIQALSDPKPSIRTEAAWTLFAIHGQRAKDALESAYNSEQDEAIKCNIKIIIDRINGQWSDCHQ